MTLFALSLLGFFVFMNVHVSALSYDQRVVTEEEKFNKPAELLTTERLSIQRRSTIGGDVMRVNSRSTFKRKQDFSFYRKPHEDGKTERAVAYYGTTTNMDGVEARINLWQPSVDREKAYSSSQIWVIARVPENSYSMIEVGWHVFPRHYRGDNKTRLFIHWTNMEEGSETGCYNLDCRGFIRNEEGDDMIGKSQDVVSTYDGEQKYITIQVKKITDSGNWSLTVDGSRVGHWPNHIIPHLAEGATSVNWGGETWIKNTEGEGGDNNDDEDIVAEMGSGQFAEKGYKRASYFDDLAVSFPNNEQFIPVTPLNLKLTADHPCYNITEAYDIGGVAGKSGFFYGGPGVGSSCRAT